jgi:hypothetical protein
MTHGERGEWFLALPLVKRLGDEPRLFVSLHPDTLVERLRAALDITAKVPAISGHLASHDL